MFTSVRWSLGSLSALTLALLLVVPVRAQIYVDVDATGANDGTSWTDAYTNLQTAINNATSSDSLWVAEGVYTPASTTDSIAFTGAKDGINIYGGFDGTETTLSAREPRVHVTVISGDVVGDDATDADGVTRSSGDIVGSNSNRVLYLEGSSSPITRNTVIDGVTITAAESGGTAINGGGLYCSGDNSSTAECSPTLRNVVFAGNWAGGEGGGMFNDGRSGGTANPRITNVVFAGNRSGARGGAIANKGGFGTASPVIVNAAFVDNFSSCCSGGAIYNDGSSGGDGVSSPIITNATFSGNSAGVWGGAIYNLGTNTGLAQPQISNTIFWGDSAASGGDEIYNDGAGAIPSISYSILEGGLTAVGGTAPNDAGGNFDKNPVFSRPSTFLGPEGTPATDDDGVSVLPGSPALDAGNNAALDTTADNNRDIVVDIARGSRVQDDNGDATATVDIGAYEGAVEPQIFRVDADVTSGQNDGLSWSTAYANLQAALDVAVKTDELWVAEGVYTPASATDSLVLTGAQDGLEIYGGFAGGETSRSARDPGANVTALSGDVDGDDNTDTDGVTQTAGDIVGSNANHVLFLDGTAGSTIDSTITDSTVIDGVTVTGGQADGAVSPARSGGGLYCDGSTSGNECSPTLRGVVFSGNAASGAGGAIFNYGSGGEASPTITAAVFTGNTASQGGAIENRSSGGFAYPTIANAVFRGNSASGNGGAIRNDATDSGIVRPRLINVTFTDNTAELSGGALRNRGATGGIAEPQIDNVILWADSAGTGDEVSNDGGNPTISHSIVQGSGGSSSWDTSLGTDGGGNLDVEPLFLDAVGGDVRLNWASPALEAGSNAALDTTGDGNDDITEDITGAPRLEGGQVDIGAYEGGDAPSTNVVYVDTTGLDGGNAGGSWSNPYRTLQAGLEASKNRAAAGSRVDSVHVAEGRYYPDEGPGQVNGDTTSSFRLVDSVDVVGGYPAGGGAFDPDAHPTVLSGDIDQDDSDPDGDGIIATPGDRVGNNSLHVLRAFDSNEAKITGFVITAGQADGSAAASKGGGLFADAVIDLRVRLSRFQGNGAVGKGGALHAENGGVRVVIQTNFVGNSAGGRGGAISDSAGAVSGVLLLSRVRSNEAVRGGGGISLDGTEYNLERVTLAGNRVTGSGATGGGVWAAGGEPIAIFNSVFTGNSAAEGAGLRVATDTATTVTNTTFGNNTATGGGGGAVLVDSTTSTQAYLQNTILWGNTSSAGGDEVQVATGGQATFSAPSILDGGGAGLGGTGTISATSGDTLSTAPMFLDATGPDGTAGTADDDLRINWASPAIDQGNGNVYVDVTDPANSNLISEEPSDRIFNPRVQGPRIEIGAYEGGAAPSNTTVVYADSASGADADSSGGSWTDPYRTVQAALAAARNAKAALGGVPFDEVWVAQGTYFPDQGPGIPRGLRDTSFVMVDSVGVYGGFRNGDAFSQRNANPATNGTVLSGDLGVRADTSDNSYHVVQALTVGPSISPATELDGFTVRNGNAHGPIDFNFGGGIQVAVISDVEVAPTFRHLRITKNFAPFGAAIAGATIEGVTGTIRPRFIDVDLLQNGGSGTSVGGGAIFVTRSGIAAPEFLNVRVLGNQATQASALEVRTTGSARAAPKGANLLVSGNVSATDSSVVVFRNSTGGTLEPHLVNTTWAGNASPTDTLGTLMNVRGDTSGTASIDVRVANSVLYGNAAHSSIGGLTSTVTVDSSLVEGGWSGSGAGVIDANPQYVNPTGPDGTAGTLDDSLQVLGTSPALNLGATSRLPPDVADLDADGDTTEVLSRDLDGGPRVLTGRVEAGAYEGAESPSVVARPATAITPTTAQMNGAVVPYAPSTVVQFLIGPTGGSTQTLADSTVSGSDSVAVSLRADSLKPDTEYAYEIVADDGSRTTSSSQVVFRTSVAAPSGTADSATAVTDSSATLNATVNPGGDTTRVYFDLTEEATGDTTVYAADTLRTSLASDHPVSFSTADTLLSNTTYNYEVTAANSTDSVSLGTATFTTDNVAPVAGSLATRVQTGASSTVHVLSAVTDDGTLDTASVRVETAPSHGTATVESNGAITYTHDGSNQLSDQFTYSAADKTGQRSNGGTVEVDAVAIAVAEGTAKAGQAVSVDVSLAGGFTPTDQRTLLARRAGDAGYQAFSLQQTSVQGDTVELAGQIPDSLVTIRGVQHYLVLSDGSDTFRVPPGNATQTPVSPHQVPVSFDTLSAPGPFAPKTYRMASVPVRVTGGLKQALTTSYGSYDPTEWRLLRWDPENEKYRTFPNTDSLPSGTGFWLITEAGAGFTMDKGRSVDLSGPYRIPLQSGWNQVGAPFAFKVPWDSVLAASELSGADVDGPVSFQNGQYQRGQSLLEPWSGYFVFNATGRPDTLVVPPEGVGAAKETPRPSGPVAIRGLARSGMPPIGDGSQRDRSDATGGSAGSKGPTSQSETSSTTRASPPTQNPGAGRGAAGQGLGGSSGVRGQPGPTETKTTSETDSSRYTLRIDGRLTSAQTGPVWLGLRSGAKTGRDALDFAQVPVIGESVRLSILEEVAGEPVPHAGSFKPPTGEGASWMLRLSNPKNNTQTVRLGVDSHGALPAGHQRYLLDLEEKRPLSPEEPVSLSGNTQRRVKVIVGTKAYAKSKSDGIRLNRLERELRGNYPNPFGDETAIEYVINEDRKVTLQIYNVLGQRVRTLVDQVQKRGIHRVRWNGKNRYGDAVGSGVYFYRIQVGDFQETRKMVLVR